MNILVLTTKNLVEEKLNDSLEFRVLMDDAEKISFSMLILNK